MALLITEVEYITINIAMKEALWLQGLVKELGVLNSVVEIFLDSQSAIQLCKNPCFMKGPNMSMLDITSLEKL